MGWTLQEVGQPAGLSRVCRIWYQGLHISLNIGKLQAFIQQVIKALWDANVWKTGLKTPTKAFNWKLFVLTSRVNSGAVDMHGWWFLAGMKQLYSAATVSWWWFELCRCATGRLETTFHSQLRETLYFWPFTCGICFMCYFFVLGFLVQLICSSASNEHRSSSFIDMLE